MSIFENDNYEYGYDSKEEFLEDIIDLMNDRFSKWHYIYFKNEVYYDFLLIRTFKKSVTKYINPGSPNPLHKEKDEEVQIVIAVSVALGNEYKKIREKIFDVTRDWTKHHVIVHDIRSLRKFLENVDRENE